MPRAIDHLVIAVPDPIAAADELESALGLAVTSGGEHPGAGTFNRIAFLGAPYLELIGIRDGTAAEHSPIGMAALRTLAQHPAGGLATLALLDGSLDETVLRLRSSGSTIRNPERGFRRTADGELVAWSVATFEQLGPNRPPFIIRHEPVGSEWSPDVIERRRSEVHPSGCNVALRCVNLAVADPHALADAYAAELGLASQPDGGGHLVEVGPHTIRLTAADAARPPTTISLVCTGDTVTDRVVELFGVRFELRSPSTS
jgi:hypothetical protein